MARPLQIFVANDRELDVAQVARAIGRGDLDVRTELVDGVEGLAAALRGALLGGTGPAVGLLGSGRGPADQARADEALQASEAHLSNALWLARAGQWEYDVATDLFTFNDTFYRIYRTTASEVGGYRMSSGEYARRFCHPDDAPLVAQEVEAAIAADDPSYGRELEHRILFPGGEVGHLAVRFSIVKDGQGRTVKTFGVNQDITARKRAELERVKLEERLLATQKLEAIGGLAGGVAHDFNNLLSVIMNYLGFALAELPEGSSIAADLLEVKQAAERAAALTRKLLAFSRNQVLQPAPLNLSHVAAGLSGTMRRSLGGDVDLVLALEPALWVTLADPGQMEQVLMNLVINARDAMPSGGTLTIATANVDLDEAYAAAHPGAAPGPHVRLAVTDTGRGMDDATLARLFEPFFTTKEKGKGTGLGLSCVYGIVAQSGGHVGVSSRVGEGTTFSVYLPRDVSSTRPARTTIPPELRPQPGSETVLLAEDEGPLRRIIRKTLERQGYTVLAASNGEEALAVVATYHGLVDLLLTDVVMPGMSGRALAEELSRRQPGLKVLYMSGYTDDAIVRLGVLDAGTPFLSKPFTAVDLLAKVREALDGGQAPAEV